jgi:hypothetical protein
MQNQPAPASPISFTSSQSVEALSDQDLMRVAVYDESPARRSRAIMVYGNRQMSLGMKVANQAHSFITDKLFAVRK